MLVPNVEIAITVPKRPEKNELTLSPLWRDMGWIRRREWPYSSGRRPLECCEVERVVG